MNDSPAARLRNDPAFIARFEERAPEVAEIFAEYLDAAGQAGEAMGVAIDKLGLEEPMRPDELIAWIMGLLAGVAPKEAATLNRELGRELNEK